jgi:hypothetical protein
MKGKIAVGEQVIRVGRRGEGVPRGYGSQSWVELILRPAVGTGVKVAARARLPVAAELLIPEQRLAEGHQRFPIAHVLVERRGIGHRDRLQRSGARGRHGAQIGRWERRRFLRHCHGHTDPHTSGSRQHKLDSSSLVSHPVLVRDSDGESSTG